LDYLAIIDSIYGASDPPLKRLLLRHSADVARKALDSANAHPELHLDTEFIREAAMLHDIGVIRCDAPSIHCHGDASYILHGYIGAQMLRELGFERHARVCERHTGAGLTAADIARQNLPLPRRDFTPETLEEKLICYADKFFSKSKPDREKTMKEAEHSVRKHSEDGLLRFREWAELFG